MPLPIVTPKELKDGKTGHTEWMHKCMSDTHIQGDFKTQVQRVAVCMNLYRQAKKKHGAKASFDNYIAQYRKNGININLLP